MIYHENDWSRVSKTVRGGTQYIQYAIKDSLKDGSGNITEVKSSKIGFRSIEFSEENSKLLINGKETYVYGVNRHDHHAEKGKAMSREDMEEDIRTIKKFNFNLISWFII